jgi:predicted nucleotidyltransferase
MEISTLITEFKEFLLNSFKEGTIAKIIIFGSHTKGEATPYSDIDILVVISDGFKVEKNLLDRVYEFMVEHNVPIEVVTASVTELLLSPDYFLYNVIRKGEEVYSMRKEEIKIIALNDLRNLAEEYYESAKEVLSRKRIRLAIDAAYNAAELSAKGLIL